MGIHLPHSRQFLAHACCGQTAGWIHPAVWPKQTWAENCWLCPGHIVSGGNPAPHKIGTAAPSFRLISIVAKCMDASGYHLLQGGRPHPRRYCVRWGFSCPTERGTAATPPLFGPLSALALSPISAAAELLYDK